MKKGLIKLTVLVAIGVGVYFGYEHYFGCKETCDESCESKDSVLVTTPTVDVADSCVSTKDTTKK